MAKSNQGIRLFTKGRGIAFLLLLLITVFLLYFLRIYAPIPTIESLPDRDSLAVFTAQIWKSPINGEYGLFVIDVDTGKIWKWSDNVQGLGSLAWSVRQQRLIFEGYVGQNFGVYLISPDGFIHQSRLIQTATLLTPAWSPNGSQVAFSYQNNIYVQNIDGSDLRLLSYTSAIDSSPSWSPSGTEIVFHSYNDRNRSYVIYRVNEDGTGLEALVQNGRNPQWSPDGTKIAFEYAEPNQPTTLALMNLDGSGIHFVLPPTDSDKPGRGIGDFAWSPDGHRFIFSSGQDGFCWFDAGFVEHCDEHIYVINVDGTGLTQLTHHRQAQTDLTWIR